MCAQVVGFLVLVSGTSLYNELMRSCLPRMYDSLADSDVEVRPSLPPVAFFHYQPLIAAAALLGAAFRAEG